NLPYSASVLARTAQTVHELDQRQQILDTQRAATIGQRHEGIRVGGIRPAPRHRALRPLIVEEEHAVLAPVVAHRDEHELPPLPKTNPVPPPDDEWCVRRRDRLGGLLHEYELAA